MVVEAAEISGSMEDIKPVRNVDKNLLDLFWNLVETAQDIRCDAALGIINLLYRKQESYAENNADEFCPELKYSVERLIKGISSFRKAARQGYALALTEIMKLFPTVTVKEVLSLMEKHLPLSSKQEKSQMVIGQLLTYSAIIRSGRMKDDLESLPAVVLHLYLLSSGKNYIQETTYKLMSHLFSQISEQNFKENVWPEIKKKLSCGWEACSPHMFWFLLLCQRMFPETVTTKFLQKNWECKDFLSSENFGHLQKVVKQSTSVHPQLSPVCSELLQSILSKKKVAKFWNAIFDEALFKTDRNEKTYMGFKVVQAALSMASETMISSILSPNFSSIITACLLSNTHPMHTAASELATFLGSYVKTCTDPYVQVVILKAFIQPPGTVLREQMLSRKEVGVIINNLSSEAVKLYYEVLQSIVLQKSNNDEEQDLLNRKRCQAFSQIRTLISHLAVVSDTEWRLQVIKFLFLHSFFEIKGTVGDLDPKWIPHCGSELDSLDASVRQACMHGFNRALDSLIRKTDNSSSSLDQQVDLLKSIADYAQHLLQSSEQVAPLQPLEKIQESWDSMMHTVKKLTKQSKKGGKTAGISAFQIFLLQLGLQLFSDADHIPNMIEELEMCCKKALKMEKDTESTSDEPPWIQVFVDLMLSLISQESHHMRHVVNSVFSVVHSYVTQDSIQQILDIINPEKAVNDILMEGSEDEDAEFASGSSSEEENEESEENEKSEKNDDLSKLKARVQEALGAAADVSDADSEEVLTDSEMSKLDEALSEAFRVQSKVGHLQFSTEEKTLMNFRIRCLDLILIYLKTEPSMSSVLRCILPLLSAYVRGFRSRHQQSLSQKAHSTLQLLLKVKKFQNCDGTEFDEIRKILHQLIEKASKETNTPVVKLLNSLCVYMVLCERKLELSVSQTEKKAKKSTQPSCLDQYKTALDTFVNQVHSRLTPHMFVALMNSCPETAWSFVKPLQDVAFDSNVRLFKRAQCLGLLLSALRFSKGQKTVTSEMWQGVFQMLLPRLVEALCPMLGGESEIKPTYTTELFEVLVAVFELNKEKCSEALIIENKEQFLQMLTGLSSAKKKRLAAQGKRSINKLIRLLGGEIPKPQSQSKRNVPEEDNEVEEEENKKSKKIKLDKNKKRGKKNKLEESNESLKEAGSSKSTAENSTAELAMNESGSSSLSESDDSEMSDR